MPTFPLHWSYQPKRAAGTWLGDSCYISSPFCEYPSGNTIFRGPRVNQRGCWQPHVSVSLCHACRARPQPCVSGYSFCRAQINSSFYFPLIAQRWERPKQRCYDISRFPPVLGTINYKHMAIKTSLQNEPAPWHFHLVDLCHALKKSERVRELALETKNPSVPGGIPTVSNWDLIKP